MCLPTPPSWPDVSQKAFLTTKGYYMIKDLIHQDSMKTRVVHSPNRLEIYIGEIGRIVRKN